jgi:hypothetical protein
MSQASRAREVDVLHDEGAMLSAASVGATLHTRPLSQESQKSLNLSGGSSKLRASHQTYHDVFGFQLRSQANEKRKLSN